MGLVCFRLRQGDSATNELMRRLNSSGRLFVSHTALDGRFTIRVAIGNIRTRQRDIEQLWGSIVEALHGIDPIDA
jgi:aromatic-L-amino-acid decarboxylase